MKINRQLIPFIVISTVHLISHLAHLEIVIQCTKPLITLSIIYYLNKSIPYSIITKLTTVALALSFVGDLSLIFEGDLFFLIGLGSFLLVHVLYSFLAFNLVDDERKLKMSWKDIPIVLAGFLIFLLIKDNTGTLQIPVLIYTVIISFMAIMARQRWKRVDRGSFWFMMVGALFFLISDAILAIDKFMEPLSSSGFLIMLTYIIAQISIAQGIIAFIQKIRHEAGS